MSAYLVSQVRCRGRYGPSDDGIGILASSAADPVRAGPRFCGAPGRTPPPGTKTTRHDTTFHRPYQRRELRRQPRRQAGPRTRGAGTTTVPAEIIPIDLVFEANGGQAFNGSDSVQAVVNSPMFQPTDYSAFSDNVGVQYKDAIMRSQVNQAGASPFHLKLKPTVMPTLRLSVPPSNGQVKAYATGAHYGCHEFASLFPRMWSANQLAAHQPDDAADLPHDLGSRRAT